MSYPTGSPGGSSFPAPTPDTHRPTILLAVTALLGVMCFLLGFGNYVVVKGSYGAETATFFEFGPPTALLGFLLLGGVAAGLSLLAKRDLSGVAAAATVVGFVTLIAQGLNISENLQLDWGGYIVPFVAFVQAVVAVIAYLRSGGPIKPSAPGPQQAYAAYGQPSSAYSQPAPSYPPQLQAQAQPHIQAQPLRPQGAHVDPARAYWQPTSAQASGASDPSFGG